MATFDIQVASVIAISTKALRILACGTTSLTSAKTLRTCMFEYGEPWCHVLDFPWCMGSQVGKNASDMCLDKLSECFGADSLSAEVLKDALK